MFCKKGVLRNFATFTGKHLCQSLFFNKLAGLRPSALLKKRLWHKCFPVKLAKFLRTPFFTEHLRWLLLWFILVTSIVVTCVTWASWFSGHRFKLEAENFTFHILQKNFPNFGMKILFLCSARSLRSFYFSLFCSQLIYTCSKHGVVQTLVKTSPKRIHIFSLFFSQAAYHCSVNSECNRVKGCIIIMIRNNHLISNNHYVLLIT